MSFEIFRKRGRVLFSSLVLLLAVTCAPAWARAQSAPDQETDSNNDGSVAVVVRQLSSADALKRQHAAEELARLEASDQRRVVEGYRLQEKNARVRLALDWALFRMGKKESLFAVVRALDSSHSEQANGYLLALDSPEPLYFFLERVNGNTQVKLLDILAQVGNAESVERIRPYQDSFDPKIADAARNATHQIEQRTGESPRDKSTRPRQVEKGESTP